MSDQYFTPTAEDHKLVDSTADRIASSFVWNKNQLTPEIEAQLDKTMLELNTATSLDFLIAKHAEHEDEWDVIPPGAPEYRGK